MNRKIFIGAALPYANGSLHLGHVTGLIGSDVLARYFRLNSDSVLFVSGSDCHGTPIILEADKQGVSPSDIAEKYHKEFIETLVDGLGFSFDFYTKTSTEKHLQVVQEIFLKLYKNKDIYKRTDKLPFCEKCQKFLPDRYIEGKCYLCGFESARGDQCDNCGNLMDTKKLVESRCKICGDSPEWKDSEHFFLRLTKFQDELKKWVKESEKWKLSAKNFTFKLLEQGLIDRSITRDINWGIPVPLKGYESKRIYVWFEAVCAYLSGSKEWAESINNKDKWKDFWQNKEVIHYYVHGKDNVPFHSIIWPTILLSHGNLNLPDHIISSEYLTLEKKQFSKSRNWAIWLPEFLNEFDFETLRYYLISNSSENSDADFTWKDFQTRINSELIGNFGNYVNRVLSFINNKFPEGIPFPEVLDKESKEFLKLAESKFSLTSLSIENGHFRKGLRHVLELVEHGNRYIDNAEPWASVKKDKEKTKNDLAVAGHIVKCLAILVNPFLPKSSKLICSQINQDYLNLKWEYPLPGFLKTENPEPMYQRIEDDVIKKRISLLEKNSTN